MPDELINWFIVYVFSKIPSPQDMVNRFQIIQGYILPFIISPYTKESDSM